MGTQIRLKRTDTALNSLNTTILPGEPVYIENGGNKYIAIEGLSGSAITPSTISKVFMAVNKDRVGQGVYQISANIGDLTNTSGSTALTNESGSRINIAFTSADYSAILNHVDSKLISGVSLSNAIQARVRIDASTASGQTTLALGVDSNGIPYITY